jgi:hypothetical protein
MTNIATCGFSHEEALAMAKEALDGCLEADISRGNAIPPPVCKDGYPVTVAPHIALSLRLRELRGARPGRGPYRGVRLAPGRPAGQGREATEGGSRL